MARRTLATIAAAFVAFGICVTATASAAVTRHGAPLGGINIGSVSPGESFAEIDSEVASAKALHAKLIRAELRWSQFEPEAEGKISAAAVKAANRLMEDAAADHIQVIALTQGTPCWASSAPAPILESCASYIGNEAGAWPPREAADYGVYAGWLAKTYGSDLAAIEVWNEPDQANELYLAGPEKARHYAELLKAAYPAIKRADSEVKVLAGSVVGANGAFMKALYKEGIKGYYNGVAVHFYTLTLGSVRRFREVQLENGDHTPLWLDEFGWSSCWPEHKIEQEQGCVTVAGQARNITNSIRELSRTPYLAALLPYTLRDSPTEQFGVLNAAGKAKPSFGALAKAFASPFGPISPITLHLEAKGGQVIASGSAPVGDYMKLEATNGHWRQEQVFTLNRFNRYSLKISKVLGTRHVTVRVWQYWLGSGHATQRNI